MLFSKARSEFQVDGAIGVGLGNLTKNATFSQANCVEFYAFFALVFLLIVKRVRVSGKFGFSLLFSNRLHLGSLMRLFIELKSQVVLRTKLD